MSHKIYLGIWGSNAVGKTFVCDILKRRSRYSPIIMTAALQESGINRKIVLPLTGVLQLWLRCLTSFNVLIFRRFYWIKPRYEQSIARADSLNKEVILFEEGLIKKMVEIFPLSAQRPSIYQNIIKGFMSLADTLLALEASAMEGFVYVYCSWDDFLSFNKKRSFCLSATEEDLSVRFMFHELWYALLVCLCRSRGIPVLTIYSRDDEDKIIAQFDNFLKELKNKPD